MRDILMDVEVTYALQHDFVHFRLIFDPINLYMFGIAHHSSFKFCNI